MEPTDARAARAAALDALARRDHASGELRRKLRDKGYDHALVDTLIERLCAEKLIDDRRFVDNFIELHATRGQGPVRIRSELRNLGIDSELVEAGLAGYGEWLAVLKRARDKKFGTPPPAAYAERQRQARFLSYRGFTGAQIRLALGFDTELDAND